MRVVFSWIAVAALVAPVLWITTPTFSSEVPAWGTAKPGALEGVTMRRIGDLFEVETWITQKRPNGVAIRNPVSAGEITWTIEEGDGKLLVDPESGRTLFKPTGEGTLVVRPTVGALVGRPIVVGMDPVVAKIAGGPGEKPNDAPFDASGGGVCGHRAGPRMFDDPVDVRSVVSASVIPVSRTERVVRYAYGDYYSYHDEVGTMRIQYNPDRTSEVRLRSLSPEGEPFFPAKAEGDLYFIIETLRDGYQIANWKPMTIAATVLHWPPFETPVVNREGVSFYSMERPDVEMHRIAYQEFYLYPSSEIEVAVDRFEVKDGEMTGDFTLTNKTKNSGAIRWFVIGDIHEPITPPVGLLHLDAGGSTKVSYRAAVKPSAIPQFITLGAVSETGTRMVGFRRINFTTSEVGGKKIALNEVPLQRQRTPDSPVTIASR